MLYLQIPLLSTLHALLLIIVLLSGCVSPVVEQPVLAPDTTDSSLPEPVIYGKFSEQTLLELLTAEFAGIRSGIAPALDKYRAQAHQTRDPGVIDRAVRIARFLKREDVVIELAELWVEVEPDNLDVRRLIAFQLAQSGRVVEAFVHGEYLFKAGDNSYLQALTGYAQDATKDDKERLLALYKKFSADYQNNAELLLVKALLLRQLEEHQQSLTATKALLKLDPESETGQLLYAQLVHQQGDVGRALKGLKKALKKTPESKRLRLQYARFLAETNLAKSREQIMVLVAQYPQDSDLLFSLALVSKELGLLEAAKEILNTLIARRQHLSDAHYLLGRLAEHQENLDLAVGHYRKVSEGKNLIAALVQLTDIFARQGDMKSARDILVKLRNKTPELSAGLYQIEAEMLSHYGQLDVAFSVLTSALDKTPGDINLLYARSTIASLQNDLPGTEKDLRAVLASDPDNATALNALGYTLTNLSSRYAEAQELIEKALAIEPDNPAIIDSLGWVYYRQGDLDNALKYLKKAYKVYPDQEVAAHLGEVLWVRGQREKAEAIWQLGVESSAEAPAIMETIKRLSGKPLAKE